MFDQDDVEDTLEVEDDDQLDDIEEAEDEGALPADADIEAGEADDDGEQVDGESNGDDAIVISFNDDEGEEAESAPIRQIREQLKEEKRRRKELEERLEKSAPKEPDLGPKPKLEDYDYDGDAYDTALLEWNDRKRKHDEQKAKEQEALEQAKTEYEGKLKGYHEKKASLGVKNFDEIEQSVREGLPVDYQSVIVAHSEDPALVVYALGKNPKLMEELAKAKDPVQFGYQLAKMETKMKVTSKTRPAPEKRSGGGTVSPPKTSEKQLAKLREEAQKTGDFSKVTEYRRKMQKAKT